MSKIDNRTTGNKLLDSLKVETEVIGFSQIQLTSYIEQAEKLVDELAKDLDRYKGGYYIMMEYYDSIPDDDKQDVDKKLMKFNL